MSKNESPIFKLEKSEDVPTTSKIELIKNLIFGDDIQAYDSEFEKLKKDILSKKKVLEKLVEETKTDLEKAIDDVSSDLDTKISEMEKRLENKLEETQNGVVQRETLGKLLVELGQKIKSKK